MSTPSTILLESSRVAPPPGMVAEQTLPLIFFDITWLHFHPIHQLLFYQIPNCSKPYFLETLVPKLKESLSLTLKHFFPLAGNIVYPLKPDMKPVIRYQARDSVSVAISESSADFDNLVGNHPRDADKFYDFIPKMEPIIEESDHKLLQVLAVQVTLFSGRGVCIGLNSHHSVGDASSFSGFIRSWASINKHGEGEYLIRARDYLPLFDRALISYPLELDTIYWNHIRETPSPSPDFALPTNRDRATFIFTESEIKKLKDLVQARFPGLGHVSSFVVMTAYVWNCLVKSFANDVDDVEFELFLFAVDLRRRLHPPVPGNYFGNCLTYRIRKMERGKLVGDEGFFVAAEAISEEIRTNVIGNDEIMGGAEGWLKDFEASVNRPPFSVSGSTRFDLYSADFGWGKARKMEVCSIDGQTYSMSLCKSRDFEGGFEVGLSFPKTKMDSFAALFDEKKPGRI
ncbi:hypothetical protein ACS0TY_017785 [Phlomoides rotata]